MVEVRADAWRITHVTRRPWPSNVEDIGTFQSVLDLMIAAAVVTNGALISFTMPVLDGYSQSVRFWVFIGFMWVVFSAQYVIRAAIPDEPTSVLIQTERTQLYEDKLIKRLIDEDVENSKKEGGDTRIEWVYENIKSKHK